MKKTEKKNGLVINTFQFSLCQWNTIYQFIGITGAFLFSLLLFKKQQEVNGIITITKTDDIKKTK